MTTHSTRADRLDRAIGAMLDGTSPSAAAATAGIEAEDRPLLVAAAALRAALASSLVAPRFEARLGARLSGAVSTPWLRRHSGLIVTGAVGSAVGVGVTAYAVWRSTRRSSGVAHRLLQR
jgi:hypothetical protein